MSAAVFGLIGVVVGASLNIVGGFILAWRSERREVRTAARLVMAELEQIRSELNGCLRTRTWPTRIRANRWRENETRLARSLPASVWAGLSVVHASLQLFNVEGQDQPGGKPIGDDLAHLRMTLDVTQEALDQISRIAVGTTHDRRRRMGAEAYEAYLDAAGEKPKLSHPLRRDRSDDEDESE